MRLSAYFCGKRLETPSMNPKESRMDMKQQPNTTLPDIASQPHDQLAGKLDWVGMNRIEVPVRITGKDGVAMQTPATSVPSSTSASRKPGASTCRGCICIWIGRWPSIL